MSSQTPPRVIVNSHNEWDPLEEVIVGRVTGAAVPPWHVSLRSTAPRHAWSLLEGMSGRPAPEPLVEAAQRDLDALLAILESSGVEVRRPDPLPQTGAYSTPDWRCEAGYSLANPRDLLMVLGDEILETPTAWRSRYFETHAYRSLLHEYFGAGARWTAAPKPRLTDDFYDESYEVPGKDEPICYSITERECTFDAADFVRCGRDIFYTQSNVTNRFGIEWLRRHLGERYRLHRIESRSRQPMHIDTTFMPLAPGKALINPDNIAREQLPAALDDWDCRYAPRPVIKGVLELSSIWLTMNVLMLDPQRVLVEATQEPLMEMLDAWGFTPVPCPFMSYYVYGGGFHCATLDIRRRGELRSYCS